MLCASKVSFLPGLSFLMDIHTVIGVYLEASWRQKDRERSVYCTTWVLDYLAHSTPLCPRPHLASFVTWKIIDVMPVMNSHSAQYLPVEFAHLFPGSFYPKENKMVVVETACAGKILKKPAAHTRRGLDTRTTWGAHIHLYLPSL